MKDDCHAQFDFLRTGSESDRRPLGALARWAALMQARDIFHNRRDATDGDVEKFVSFLDRSRLTIANGSSRHKSSSAEEISEKVEVVIHFVDFMAEDMDIEELPLGRMEVRALRKMLRSIKCDLATFASERSLPNRGRS